MTARITLALCVAACVAAGLEPPFVPTASGQASQAAPLAEGERDKPPSGNPECAKVRAEALYRGLGYDHIVEIENTCKKTVTCTVVTDVNPAATTLTVEPGKKESVTTFRGSPAREFKADVSCKEAS